METISISAINKIKGMMESAVTDGVFPGAVLLFSKEGSILVHEAFGTLETDGNQKMVKDTIFDLASLTKPLATALCSIKLIETGQFFLDQKIDTILDECKSPSKNEITIDMLLRHTSGLPAHKEYFKKINLEAEHPRQEIRKFILDEPLETTPGTNQVYSDLGYMLLTWVIEEICRQRLDIFAHQHLFAPLGIEDLFYIDLLNKDRIPHSKIHRIAPTEKCPWRQKLLRAEVHDDNAWAAGGIEGHAGLFGDAASVHMLCYEILKGLQGKDSLVLNKELL
ncbi:MAG: serine hydrolase, partial [Desulfobacteraceae bacterium]|nr:serine hydrolase [Desulfobacteraceae bacterium]